MAEKSRFKTAIAFVRQSFIESLFRNVGMPYRHQIGILMGATAALLALTSNILDIRKVAWVFVIALAVTAASLIFLRANMLNEFTKKTDQFAWGLLVTIILGFGLGGLIFQTRSWWFWLWRQYLRINEAHEVVLEFLFILGVILGVFIVRNWGKEQKAFTESLTGILGGTFIAAIFGESLKEQGLTPMRALTFYGLGFVMSAALNLLVAARLTANYTNKRSIVSRAVLDFLYGSERAKAVDELFLKNFKEDPDYAKTRLIETLTAYCQLVKREFSKRMQRRMAQRFEALDAERELLCRDLPAEQKAISEKLEAMAEKDPALLKQLDTITGRIRALESQLKPCYFHELLAIECPEKKPDSPALIQDPDRPYYIVYKELGTNANFEPLITSDMFRAGVAIRWQDSLEYIVAPGEYRGSFPYVGSVAGLSLMVRQTIIMNRDRMKQYRSKDYRDGICPRDTEQWRGLDEIDFLSYISIPVVARFGSVTENGVGVVNIDTKLFVTHCKLDGQKVEGKENIFRTILTPRELVNFASNLYEQEDRDVDYIEKLTRLIVPVLELYAKCRVGAT